VPAVGLEVVVLEVVVVALESFWDGRGGGRISLQEPLLDS
jgi:hypothetical protein